MTDQAIIHREVHALEHIECDVEEVGPEALEGMLGGDLGPAKAMAARLLLDLTSIAGASTLVPIRHAHVSGVSVLTGGLGLERFLKTLSNDPEGKIAVPTTLNAAGCDPRHHESMELPSEDFLERQWGIVQAYERLGIQSTLSCTPYDHPGLDLEGIGCWAESNAVCFANSFTSLRTNRESGLSALASALTGLAPRWGMHLDENRRPNVIVRLTTTPSDSTRWSIVGDIIGRNLDRGVSRPLGPMPYITCPDSNIDLASKKALCAASANHGVPMLWLSEEGKAEPVANVPIDLQSDVQTMQIDAHDIETRLDELAPTTPVSRVVIGCPQADVGEVREVASALMPYIAAGRRLEMNRMWLFTNRALLPQIEEEGLDTVFEEAGVQLLVDTCPEVVPYNRKNVQHLLTNSMKAEHYLTSGLNSIHTSVTDIPNCIEHAFSEDRPVPGIRSEKKRQAQSEGLDEVQITKTETGVRYIGKRLTSQSSWTLSGQGLVTQAPITWLGYVDRFDGTITETGHPLEGSTVADTILIMPKASGSTVAPYVLMELAYRNRAPKAVLLTDICPLTIPACSLLSIPCAVGFKRDILTAFRTGDSIKVISNGDNVEVIHAE